MPNQAEQAGEPTGSDVDLHRPDGSLLPVRRQRAVLALLLLGAVLLWFTACDGDRRDTSATSTPEIDALTEARQEISRATDQVSAVLTLDGLPTDAPRGFARADVIQFARQALDILRRGISPTVQSMAPNEAVNYVLEGQYPATIANYKANMNDIAAGLDWQFVIASRFDQPPVEPAHVLAVRWQTTTMMATQDDGAQAPTLRLSLEVVIRHDVTLEDATTAPIIIQRTITLTGFRPRGGKLWWPALTTSLNTYGDDRCALANGALLRPSSDPDALKQAENRIKKLLAPETVQSDPDARSDSRELHEYVDENCS
ncbi:hypothetical protein [Nocardioides sp. WS12]|uniref:hypothetical protein n=1 Tax=Nocardioides sp. WS12 TaxID=2486272 RepID=UPI0015FDF398|nr:hypothetical protein [Nocardioides sp. WS12]